MPPRPSLLALFLAALRLGCTGFGGPVAHLAHFHRDYVQRRQWISETDYADLVALCQFLPGPSSSQIGFGIGLNLRGLAGGLAAWLGFTLPSAVLMIAASYGLATLGNIAGSGWVHGLKLAAVAVVAQAVIAMARRLCPDLPRAALALAAAGLLFWLPWAGSQVAVIALGALIGWLLFPGQVAASGTPSPTVAGTVSLRAGALTLGIFGTLLLALPVVAGLAPHGLLAVADKFYVAGALVFGGGHVVLPLLERGLVTPGWIGHDRFLAGYGLAQVLPGPLFTFAAFLGTGLNTGPGGWVGGVWAVVWIFLPGLMLVYGAWPWWQKFRAVPAVQAALSGANAAVVGLLLSALIRPIGTSAIGDWRDVALAVAACLCLHLPRVSPWMIVPACALAGQWLGH